MQLDLFAAKPRYDRGAALHAVGDLVRPLMMPCAQPVYGHTVVRGMLGW